MQRRNLAKLVAVAPLLAAISVRTGAAETLREEAQEHPRIAAAIRELEGAVEYMRAAPHDFGGHKLAAVRASERAIVELRKALAFRARRDR